MKTIVPMFLLVFTALSPAWAEKVVEDFENYSDGQIVGASAKSQPWRRMGNATVDNVVITSHPDKVIDGHLSGYYVVRWPARYGSARYHFDTPLNAETYQAVTITLRSDTKNSKSTLRFAIDDGETSFLSKQSFPITDRIQVFTEQLEPARFERVAGQGSFEQVLSSVANLGFNLENPADENNDEVTEAVYFDSLKLLERKDQP